MCIIAPKLNAVICVGCCATCNVSKVRYFDVSLLGLPPNFQFVVTITRDIK